MWSFESPLQSNDSVYVCPTRWIALFSGAALLLAWLGKTHSTVRFRMAALKIDPRILARILKIGVPAGMQAAVFSLANIIIQSAINSLGTTVMAASSAAFNIEIV